MISKRIRMATTAPRVVPSIHFIQETDFGVDFSNFFVKGINFVPYGAADILEAKETSITSGRDLF